MESIVVILHIILLLGDIVLLFLLTTIMIKHTLFKLVAEVAQCQLNHLSQIFRCAAEVTFMCLEIYAQLHRLEALLEWLQIYKFSNRNNQCIVTTFNIIFLMLISNKFLFKVKPHSYIKNKHPQI